MAYFDYTGDTDISADQFLRACDAAEIEDLIQLLKTEGYLPDFSKSIYDLNNLCISEMEYEDSLNRLHGKWNRLTAEEEQTIIKISKKF